MKVKAIAPWFGGKRTMAPLIVTELGKHGQYFEPFCGSMAVLFAKEPTQKETVNDLHGGLICLARVLSDDLAAPPLYERLQGTLFSEDLVNVARQNLEGKDPPWWFLDSKYGENPEPIIGRRSDANMSEYAYWYFLASWMGRNGTAGTDRIDYQIAVRWTKGGGSPTVRWRHAVDSIPAWHERLRNVVILHRDAFKIIDRFEDVSATAIYVDPPYPQDTRGNMKKSRGGRYKHEFNHQAGGLLDAQDDHERLRDILANYKHARIVVSYYDCPQVRQLYDGWTFTEHTRQKHLHAANGRGARPKNAPEVLIMNGPSYA